MEEPERETAGQAGAVARRVRAWLVGTCGPRGGRFDVEPGHQDVYRVCHLHHQQEQHLTVAAREKETQAGAEKKRKQHEEVGTKKQVQGFG